MAKRWRRKARKQARKHENLLVQEKLPYTKGTSHKHDWKTEIKISQGYICAFCGKKGTDSSLDIHHCIPKARKGKDTKENCVAICRTTCHRNYHKKHGLKISDRHGNPIE